MVWYPKDDFDAANYEVPETWDDLIALSDQIVDDGGTPWCIGLESGGDSGWPATDWMEDIMLRTAGGDVYDQWYKHEIPFNDDAVKAAGERFGEILFTDGYVLGGAAVDRADRVRRRAASDVQRPARLLPAPAGQLHQRRVPRRDAKRASTTTGSRCRPSTRRARSSRASSPSSVPTARRPEVVDFLERFIAENVQCEMGGVVESSRISPNVERRAGLLRQRHPG